MIKIKNRLCLSLINGIIINTLHALPHFMQQIHEVFLL